MSALVNWLDHRTGLRTIIHEALYERIPGGARWRYVWGSTLVFAFFVQMITGIFLWMSYSPSGQTAWESVYYIQYEMHYGWLLRGLHHFMAQAMVVLLALHLMQVVIDGAYRAPREFNFWLGLILMQLVLALSLTGYLLPWDQKGFWATRVATNLTALVPGCGTSVQQLVVGGADYGHHTITRFFALHAGLLPALLILFLVLHLAIFRRHGIHARNPNRGPVVHFWPDQVLRDAVACLAVLAVVLLLIFRPLLLGQPLADNPGAQLGAHLDAPADPSTPYSAARPEWYFLFLFQFLKYFEGEHEVVGAIYVPAAIMGLLFLMPIVGRWRLGHGFNVALVLALLVGAGVLTGQAWYDDHMASFETKFPQYDPTGKKREESKAYLAAVEQAEAEAQRALVLVRVSGGIPPSGAISLLRSDPKAQGPRLFEQHCASCHSHTDEKGRGVAASEPSAPNLYGFASRGWIAGLLDPQRVAGPHYFGGTAHSDGDMVNFVKDTFAEVEQDEARKVVLALSAEAQLPAQRPADQQDAAAIEAGRELIASEVGCTDCHKFHDAGEEGLAPDLTGYGSREWLIGMIRDPNHARFYGENNDRMPAFLEHPDQPLRNRLSAEQIGLIADWLRGDWYEPSGDVE